MRPLDRLLAPGLVEAARLLEKLNFSLRALLPQPMAEHCWAAAIRGQELVLVTDAGTFASQLRYMQHEIIKQLNAEHRLELKRCRIRISAPRREREPQRRRLSLSSESAETLARSAESFSDPELKAALLKLARRGKSR